MPDLKTARAVARKIEVELIEGTYLDRRKVSRITFRTMAKRYLAHSKATKRSWRRDQTSLRALGKAFSTKRLADISVRDVEAYKVRRLTEVSPQSVRHELQCLCSVFRTAIEWGEAVANPAAKVRKPNPRNERLRYLSHKEEAKLMAQLARHLRPIVVLAIYTGMRESEVLGLTWDQVDMENELIHLQDTKNGRRRSIPMAKIVRQTLRKAPRHIRSPYVFCKISGHAYGRVDKGVRAACKRAEIRGVVFHTFRHTFASRMTMAGVHPFTLQELLGHSSLAMVRRYSHLSPAHRKAAISAMDSMAIGPAMDPADKAEAASGEKHDG